MKLNAKTAQMMLRLDELAGLSEAIGLEFVRMAYDLASNPNSIKVWKKAMPGLRERGEDYIRLGSKSMRAADFIEPILDEMLHAGKETF